MHIDNCTTEQQEQLLRWFMYRVTPEQRTRLRSDLPNAYAAVTGAQVSFGSLAWARAEGALKAVES